LVINGVYFIYGGEKIMDVAINITLDYIYKALRNANYILLGILIVYIINTIFKIYTYFKNK